MQLIRVGVLDPYFYSLTQTKTTEEDMFTFVKRTVCGVAVIAGLSAPATASAMINGDPSGGVGMSWQPAQLQAYPPAIAKYQHALAQSSAPVASPPAGAVSAPAVPQPSAQAAFDWADAGIGAAGVLVLIGVGSGTAVARRRRAGASTG
ncbi:MAG: hypothetical protein JO286_07870 [Solirubrobacterales bacterium]|nr:hypothetical protein [Solirubrobacterales bacterium]